MNRFKEFLALHQNPGVLLVGNAWNAQSARILEEEDYKVIGTSSAAVADSQGYADGEEMGFDFYFRIIERVVASIKVPVTVDLEGGYGSSTDEVVANIKQLYQLGVAGINIEDSVVKNGVRHILDKDVFADRLRAICTALTQQQIEMFINVRSDSYLIPVNEPDQDAFARIEAYQHTGIHGLFFPCLSEIDDIAAVTKRSVLPVNVMCVPGLPDCETLALSGIKRVRIGPFLNMRLYRELPAVLNSIKETGNFNSLF